MHLAYDYIGFNRKNPRLADKRVRRAIAHLVNTDEIIDVLLYGCYFHWRCCCSIEFLVAR